MIRAVLLAFLLVTVVNSFVIDYIPRNFNNPDDPNDKVLRSKEVRDCFNNFDDVTSCVATEVAKYVRSSDYSAWARSAVDVPGFDVALTGKSGSRHQYVKKNCWAKEDTDGQFSLRFFWESSWSTALCMYSYSCGGKRISGSYDVYSRYVSYGREINEATPDRQPGNINNNNFTGDDIRIKTEPFFVKSARLSEADRGNENPTEFRVNSTFQVVPRLNHTEIVGRFSLNIFDEDSKDNKIRK